MKKGYVAGAVLLVLASGCGKLSDAQKQSASDIASGLAGGTGKSLSTSVASLTAPTPSAESSRVSSVVGQTVEGMMWLTRFQLFGGPLVDRWEHGQDLTLQQSICSSGTTSYCTSSCNSATAATAFTVSCTLPASSGYNCAGTEYTFNNSTFAITADFTNTTGTYGAGTGSFALSISIAGDVSGGGLDGKRLECGMGFTINITGLKAGTVTHFSPNCDGFSCKYDGKDLGCEDVQAKMASSTLSCT
jgi:hypothetical protein